MVAGAVARVERRTSACRWAGVLVGLAVGLIVANGGGLGRGLLLAAPLGGLCVLLGVLAGELSVGSAPAGPRRASVTARRVRDYLPRGLAACVGVATAVLALLLAATTAAASADDLGRAGRALFHQCSSTTSQWRSPWPGSFYSVPLGVVVLVGLAAAAVVLHRVVRRPRPGDPAEVGAVDDGVRRRAARAVTGVCGVLVSIPLAGVSVVAAIALTGFSSCGPAWWPVVGLVLLGLVPVWAGLFVASAAAVAAPVPAPDGPASR